MSEASCPNFEPRAHARLTGLTTPGEGQRALVRATQREARRARLRHNLTIDARPRFFESLNSLSHYALLEEQVRRARSDDGIGCKPTSHNMRQRETSLRLQATVI